MKECPSCKGSIPEGGQHCPNCGWLFVTKEAFFSAVESAFRLGGSGSASAKKK
jgi:hypothetical protein